MDWACGIPETMSTKASSNEDGELHCLRVASRSINLVTEMQHEMAEERGVMVEDESGSYLVSC